MGVEEMATPHTKVSSTPSCNRLRVASFGGDRAEAYGYVNGSLPDAELDAFVDGLAARIGSFDKWAISNTKRLANAASLPADVEMAAGWDACIASVERPTTQARIKAFMDLGFHKPGDVDNRIGHYLDKL
jgi:enoyl-CoA hydratase/carnithine racemase